MTESVDVHATAIVEPGALLGSGVKIGPFCYVGSNVELGDSCVLMSHVCVSGRTIIGARAQIYPFASIGHAPQDLKYSGEPSSLHIGSDCIIREGVTLNPGTEKGDMKTLIGDRCVFLANSHVGHDCHLGDGVLLANNVLIAGHVMIDARVTIGGGSAVAQFLRLGVHVFVAGMAAVTSDVVPYGRVRASGHTRGMGGVLAGVNVIGMRRHGISDREVSDLLTAYRMLFKEKGAPGEITLQAVSEKFKDSQRVKEVVDFLRASGKRAICLPLSYNSLSQEFSGLET